MRNGTLAFGSPNIRWRASDFIRKAPVAFVALAAVASLLALPFRTRKMHAASNSSASTAERTGLTGTTSSLADLLGIRFVAGSTSTVLVEREGKKYVVDLAAQTIREVDSEGASPSEKFGRSASALSSPKDTALGAKIFAENCTVCHGTDGKGLAAVRTPDFTRPNVQAALTEENMIRTIRDGKEGTLMPAWGGKLSEAEILAAASFLRSLRSGEKRQQMPSGGGAKQKAKVYEPPDDYLFGLPTGRRLERHGFYVNFTHRFVLDPAFSGKARAGVLFGLDGFAVSSFGVRFGITDKLSVSAYRSPSIIGRPIELMAAYHFLDEHDGYPLNASFRFSVDGQNDFSRNFTTNFEGIFSRSLTRRAQLYLVPTVSLENHRLILKPGALEDPPPDAPGVNSFSLGIGGALDIRPSVALVAEVIPTLVNGRALGVHRPAYAFGIQKRLWRHAFTLGFSNSPGTVVSQRAGTRATFLGNPSADTPSGLFIGFDLMRQVY